MKSHRHIYEKEVCPDGDRCVRKEAFVEASIRAASGATEKRQSLSFRVGESFPEIERRLKERYLRTLIDSRRSWPRGLKELSEASGVSAPTIKAWCTEFDIRLPF